MYKVSLPALRLSQRKIKLFLGVCTQLALSLAAPKLGCASAYPKKNQAFSLVMHSACTTFALAKLDVAVRAN